MNECLPVQEPVLPGLVAAVDLGSNSFHMIVARSHHGQLQVVDRLREPVRLAAGLDAALDIDAEAQQRALECLRRFGQRLRELAPEAVSAVGTSTLRRAANAQAFLDLAEQALGHRIEVVSGYEEARLVYQGVAYSLADEGQPRLVVDIGGGSTELIVGEGFSPKLMESMHMGSVSLSEACFAGGRIGRKAWRRAQLTAAMELEPVRRVFRNRGWRRTVGTSGSIQAVRRVVTEAGWSDQGITLRSLQTLRDALLKAGDVRRLDFKGLSEERLPVFAGGVAILLTVFETLGIGQMDVADGALREGVIHDLLGRDRREGVREAGVASLMARYHVDLAQAERVRASAVVLFEQVAPAWGLADRKLRQMLEWAAGLHEIGLDISHSQYHKHGAYVLEHADLGGFSQQDQYLLAALVRAHRRKFSPSRFKQLPARLLGPARHLAVLLRLAVLLHRGRGSDPLPPVSLQAGDEGLQLGFPAAWLAEHPLLQADLEREAQYLRTAGLDLQYG